MPVIEEEVPAFEVIPPVEAKRRKKPRRARRNWKPVIDALVAGRMLFLPETEVNDGNIKYLQLSLYRRGKGERLRSERTIRDTVSGRTMYVTREKNMPAIHSRPAVEDDREDEVIEVRPEDVGSAPTIADLPDLSSARGLERMGL